MINQFHPLAGGTILRGTYKIVDLRGRGGMGAVYQAEDLLDHRKVAIKQISLVADPYSSKSLFSDADIIDAFACEAALLTKLNHPSIPKVTDYFCVDNDHFFVMEFITGEDLRERLLKRKSHGKTTMPVGHVVAFTVKLLRALEYLHSQNIVHRDIKPANIIQPSQHKIKLVDFGLAKGKADPDSSETIFSKLKGGTEGYAPLEQLDGRQSDRRSDLYAVGATAYYLLTGTAPPSALTRAANMVSGMPDPLISVDEINTRVPHPLAQIIQKAMAMNPQARFQKAGEMREALAPTVDDYWDMIQAAVQEESEIDSEKAAEDLKRQLAEARGYSPSFREAFSKFLITVDSLKRQHRNAIDAILYRIIDRKRKEEREIEVRRQNIKRLNSG